MLARLRMRYRRSWMGTQRQITNGRLTLVTTASVLTFVVLPYWLHADAQRKSGQATRDAAEATYQAALASYQQDRSDWQRCKDRVESSAKLAAIAASNHDVDVQVQATFDGITLALERERPDSELVAEIRVLVDDLGGSVTEQGTVTAEYVPVAPNSCGAEPVPPVAP